MKTLKPLPITYITDRESENRMKWFDKYKYPLLNAITLEQEKKEECRGIDFLSLQSAITFFGELTTGLNAGDGVRVYFASPSGDGTVNEDRCGTLTLIFVKTKGTSDVPPYFYINDQKTSAQISSNGAKEWVHNYQLLKRDRMFRTLSHNDRLGGHKETKHIWFSLKQMEQTLDEMKYQAKEHGHIVSCFGIRFTSYTNKDYVFLDSKIPSYKRRERLTICFTFIGANGDIGIKDIDPVEFAQRLKLTKDKSFGDTFDTGIPAPPPSDTKEALDSQI
ncbi:hypothetical protein [Pedobacter miscanthi]|uniref:hypothetical protein n=1 Tax=Pedobacter miscanthi TaxID=2259170 RepID=UPI00292D1AFD|nr:hypothetical protein [Pedobacter miscanthi]